MTSPSGDDLFPPKRKRTRIVRPYPLNTLQEALAVALAIKESNAGLPFARADLARAMGTTPASSGFTTRLNSSSKYGLTNGAYNDDIVSLTPRGDGIVSPQDDAERHRLLREAALEPDVFHGFYRMLDGKNLPEDEFAANMIRREFAVHPDLAEECLAIAKANGTLAGVISEHNGTMLVELERGGFRGEPRDDAIRPDAFELPDTVASPIIGEKQTRRIFIGHSGDEAVALSVQLLLQGFGIPCEMAEDLVNLKVPRPIPLAVAEQMRACSAAVLIRGHSGPDVSTRFAVLVGAASVLYGDRLIAVVRGESSSADRVDGLTTIELSGDAGSEGLALIQELHRWGIIRVEV